MPLDLVPEPKELIFVKGLYILDAETQIVLPGTAGAQAAAAAGQLQASIQAATGLDLPVVQTMTPPGRLNVILLVCSEREAAALGLEPSETGAPPEAMSQAYSLSIQRGRIVLYAPQAGGLARGVLALCQIVRSQGPALPTLVLRDWASPQE
jgi:hypothetical protein